MSDLDTTKEYKIEFLIRDEDLDRLENALNTLKENVKKSNPNYEPVSVIVKKHPDSSGFGSLKLLKLSVLGELLSINCYYEYLNKTELQNSNKFVRLRDDLGEEIRVKSFPILANIEQSLRSFIGEKLFGIDVILEELIPEEELNKKSLNKNSPDLSNCCFFEKTTLEQMLDLITKPFSQWDNKDVIEEIKKVISESITINEVANSVNENTEKYTVLSVIFDAYLQLSVEEIKSKEKTFSESIKRIVNIRNAVMHHRPLKIEQFEHLKKSENEILKLLEELPDTPINIAKARKAKEELENIKPSLMLFKASYTIPEGLIEMFQNTNAEKLSESVSKSMENLRTAFNALAFNSVLSESPTVTQLKDSIKKVGELNRAEIEEE